MMIDHRPYVVKQGDYLTKLAHRYGFDAAEVWAHPKNADLRAARRDHDVLAPGDVVYVPSAPKRGLPFAPSATNRYRARVPKVDVTLCFQDGGSPLADEPYEVRGLTPVCAESDAPSVDGATDSAGQITLSVPLTARELTVTFPRKNAVYPLRVGDLDPETEPSGVQARLQNLGFLGADPPPDVDLGELISGAVAAFRRSLGQEGGGDIDASTRTALVKAHGT